MQPPPPSLLTEPPSLPPPPSLPSPIKIPQQYQDQEHPGGQGRQKQHRQEPRRQKSQNQPQPQRFTSDALDFSSLVDAASQELLLPAEDLSSMAAAAADELERELELELQLHEPEDTAGFAGYV